MIKKLLENHVKLNVPDESVALLLSGGVDSITAGLSAHNVGKQVHAYSFFLDGDVSYDFLRATEVAHKMGWKFTPVVVPKTNLVKDWYKLVELHCRKKTHFECVFPFLYMYPEMKEKYVITAWGADGYFGPSKKAMMRYSSYKAKKRYVKYCKEHNQKRLNWNEFRVDYLDGNCAGLKEHTRLATSYKKIHITPYLDKKVRNELMSKSWIELNTPEQKYYVRKDFTELKKFGIIKKHINLHLGSGVDKLFETLLNNSEINFNNRKRIIDVCKDWNNGVLPI